MAKMERTRLPGVYSRGSRFVAVYYDLDGIQRKKAFRTQGEAAAFKKKQEVAVHDGTYQASSTVTLHTYTKTWMEHHELRAGTRENYEIHLRLYILKHFGSRVKLTDINRASVRRFYLKLKDDGCGKGTVQKCRTVLSSLLSSAVDDEILRSNPAHGVKLPRFDEAPRDDDHEDTSVRVLSDEQIQIVLATVPKSYALLFELLACTGLRISEALALEWRHLKLDGSRPHVKVRRAYVRGDLHMGKSFAARRDVPLPFSLVLQLRKALNEREAAIQAGVRGAFRDSAETLVEPGTAQGSEIGSEPRGLSRNGDLRRGSQADDGSSALRNSVFPSSVGSPLNYWNLRKRALLPALEEAGITDGGFHLFRHTFASKHIAQGTNIVALSKVMGHSKPSITMDIYGHLMQGFEAPALEFGNMIGNPLERVEKPVESLHQGFEGETMPPQCS
jgi:integrase